jgi:UDP-glucose 4-epimerase
MDVLVTGGAGFIGSHVCRALRVSGSAGRVVVLDDLSSGLEANLSGIDDIELLRGSVTDPAIVTELVERVDAVVHLAAVPAVARSLVDPRASHDANATGTVVVLEAARRRGAKHVIVASSSSVYGTGAALPASEDQPTRPASPYAASKLAAESYALAYARSFELPVLVFRLFNVYGPGQRADHAYAAVIPAFVAAACSGNALEIHGDGNQTRDFTYVGDTVRVIVEAVLHQVVSETPVNLAFGTRRSVLTVADELERVVGHPLSRRHVPARVGDVRDSQADPTRLRALFKAVEPTALEAGLKAAVEWSERIRGGSLFESADHQP